MEIGVPKESVAGERRVALVPEVVRKLTGQDHRVVVERGAGAAAMIPDAGFEEAGATLASIASSSVTTVSGLHDVAAAAGGLTLNDRTLSGTVPAINTSGGSGSGGFGGGGSGGGGASGDA